MNDEELLHNLILKRVEDTADEAERIQLDALLESSENARRAYVEQMRVHALLSWQRVRAPIALPSKTPAEQKIVRMPRWRWITAVAAVLVAGLIGWWQFTPNRAAVTFEVVAASGSPFRVGDRLSQTSIELEQGSLSFRTESGALVDISGPARLELINSMHLRVLRGTVTADISEGSEGFIVETDQARVVDLGTRFSVSADKPGGTDVVVFEGKVEVFESARGKAPVPPKITLVEGEAIRVDHTPQSRRLKIVPLGADARSVSSAAKSDVVTDVTDNIADKGFRRFYGLIRGGMGEGARMYTTGHHRVWHSVPGVPFPSELLGADVICTFDVDRHERDLKIDLQISRPCELYVMTDSRKPAPDWVQKEFTDTGYRLRSGPWVPKGTTQADLPKFYQGEKYYAPCIVWRKRIAEAGTVTLGSPWRDDQKGPPAMYGLAVKAL